MKAKQYAPGSLDVLYNEAMFTSRRGDLRMPFAC